MKSCATFAAVCLLSTLAAISPAQTPQKNSASSPLAASVQRPWTNSLGMPMVPVAETTTLFCIWETRVQDFGTFVTEKKLDWYLPEFEQTTVHPAVNVSWFLAAEFCEWLTAKERAKGLISSKQTYRLPTDEEWSKACGLMDEQGSTPEKKFHQFIYIFPWGSGWPPPKNKLYGNYCDESVLRVHEDWTIIEKYEDGFPHTAPVGSFPPNPYGIYDLSGNVWEWTSDWIAPKKPERVARGACWLNSDMGIIALTNRGLYKPETSGHQLGFRVVLDLQVPIR